MISVGLSSCFIADDLLLEKSQPKLSLKQKVQNIITKHIKSGINDESYFKYGFSDLIIHKPKELIDLDALKSVHYTNFEKQKKIDEQIEELEEKIKTEHLSYMIEMDHIFTLKNKKTGVNNLFETRFLISDSLTVVDVDPLIDLIITKKEERAFVNYFFETPIFSEVEYDQSKLLSDELYSFFKKKQEGLVTVSEKSKFLKHTLAIIDEIYVNGFFDQTIFLKKLTTDYIRAKKDVEDYASLKFSHLFELNEGENLLGYYFFHKFSHLRKDKEVISNVYVGFSPYFELLEVYQVQKPIEEYFK